MKFCANVMKCLMVSGLLSTMVHANDVKRELLFDLRTEARRCTVMQVSNLEENRVVSFKSICDTFIITSTREAHIVVDNKWYTAIIKESPEADGGDLDNLTILSSTGKVLATKTNIPSCGNVVVALAGETGLKKEIVQD